MNIETKYDREFRTTNHDISMIQATLGELTQIKKSIQFMQIYKADVEKVDKKEKTLFQNTPSSAEFKEYQDKIENKMQESSSDSERQLFRIVNLEKEAKEYEEKTKASINTLSLASNQHAINIEKEQKEMSYRKKDIEEVHKLLKLKAT